jgi:hypothetical protein
VFKGKISLFAVMGVVAVSAVACQALASSSRAWANAVFTLAIASLLLGTLAARFHVGTAKVFWYGFASFGWCYVLLAFGPWFGEQVRHHLFTTTILEMLYPWWEPIGQRTSNEVRGLWSAVYFYFTLGHSIFIVPVALLGGLLAALLISNQPQSDPPAQSK